jgi:cytochrome c oxidase cbb3-type subunit 4
MSYEFMLELQGYLFVAELFLIAAIIYGFAWYIYKNEKHGKKNYESLARLALDDNLDSKPIESLKNK